MKNFHNFQPKRMWALILAVLVTTTILVTFTPVYAISGSVLDPIITSAKDIIQQFIDSIGNALVNCITGSLAPNFNLFYKLTHPADYDQHHIFHNMGIDTNDNMTAADYRDNSIIDYIFSYSETLGFVLVTVLAIFFLFLCMCGRSEHIKDTPGPIFIKYIVILIFLYYSWDIVYYVMDSMDLLWTELVMRTSVESSDQSLTYTNFLHGLVSADTTDANTETIILGAAVSLGGGLVDKALFYFLGIFLVWKLFKQFLKLWVEIVERYFVLTFLMLFAPIFMATFVSNATSNILVSYVRMIFSQGFLLITNSVFMKVFVFVLMHGGWTGGVTNYICAMAYMKFCMKLDSYLNSMGLNVAQTGGGLMDSAGGCMNTVVNAVRSFGMADRSVANYGKSLMAKGAATNDKTMYDKGAKYAGGISGRSTAPRSTSDAQFSSAVAKTATAFDTRKGATYYTGNTAAGLDTVADSIRIPSNVLDKTLKNGGFNATQVHSVQQLDGTKQFSRTAGTRFALKDDNGNTLAVIDGTNAYYYSNRDADWKAFEDKGVTSSAYSDYMTNDAFKNAGVDVKEDQDGNGIIRKTSAEDTFGRQVYNVPTSNGKTELWEATMVAEHPDVLDDSRAILTYNSNGDAISLRRIEKQAHNGTSNDD